MQSGTNSGQNLGTSFFLASKMNRNKEDKWCIT